ncbi:MAG: signal peptidase II [bacterium]|nr:signal peptidase II [bacterium]
MSASQPKRTSALGNKNLRTLIWPAVIIGVVVALDQFTKFWAVEALSAGPSISLIGDFLMLTLVYNNGGALGTSFGPSHYYLVAASLILLFVLYFLYQSRFYSVTSIPLSFISAGAIGNIIDRLRIGKVVDFIDVDVPDVDIFGLHLERWWTFNLADAAISCSIVFILLHLLLVQRHERKEAATSGPNMTGDNSSTPNFESDSADSAIRDDS